MAHIAESLKQKGNLAFRDGDYASADQLYTEAVTKYSRNPLLYTNRANARLKLSRPDDAICDCLKAIDLFTNTSGSFDPRKPDNPNNPQAHKAYYFLSQAQLALRHPNEALSSALRAYDLARELCTGSFSSPPAAGGKRVAPRDLQTYATHVLACKKAKWFALQRAKVRRRNGLVGDLEEALEVKLTHDLAAVDAAEDAREVGTVEALEWKEELRSVHAVKVQDLRAIAAAVEAAQGEVSEDGPVDIPDHLVDMITFEIMHDPCMTKSGQSYERATLLEHLKRSPIDPLTREPLTVDDLRTNYGLKAACEEFWSRGLDMSGWT